MTVKQPRKTVRVVLFFARSGPKRGQPDCDVAFATKTEAISFLANQHGLSVEESRQLGRDLALILKPKWHGAERCTIVTVEMTPARAKMALTG